MELQSDIAQTNENISEIKINLEDKAKDTSFHLVSLEEKQSADIVVMQQQQIDTDSRISHTVELVKQVSDGQKDVGEKISVLEETKRQISEEVEKTGKLIHQLSVKDDERQGQIKHLKQDVDDIKSDIVMVKEEIGQKGIAIYIYMYVCPTIKLRL